MVYGILSRNSNNATKRGKVKCTNTKKCGSRQLEREKYERVLLKQFEILGLSTCVGYKHPDCARVIKLDLIGQN